MNELKRGALERFYFRIICITAAIIMGGLLGVGIAEVKKLGIVEPLNQKEIALPTKIYDRNNRLITTFFSNENRTLLSFSEIPRIIMLSLITREDRTYFQHHGFSFRGTSRALFNLVLGQYVSGGSTISQQVAGTLYADRRVFSIFRKLKELWWSLQIERSWSKQEILTEYLNKVYFGHGNYGIETASQYFFSHSAKDINAAESVMLIIQLANPVKYSPLKNPNTAKTRQRTILDQMVNEMGYLSSEEADLQFNTYWDNYDFTRSSVSSAFLERRDKAPYFSEYIRNYLISELGYSNDEINTGGYSIYTTLDLNAQEKAEIYFKEGLDKANSIYQSNISRLSRREDYIYPVAALSTLLFDDVNQQLFRRIEIERKESKNNFNTNILPVLGLSHLLFENNSNTLLSSVEYEGRVQARSSYEEETVEGALISIDNRNGYITSMIGGSKFDATNQFNRAVDAFVQPGSSFKPLYYSAAVEDRLISPSTIIWDSPVVFTTEDGEAYVPQNYKGEWKGKVSVRYALSHSMNVPSLKVLNKVGFNRALEVAGALLDLPRKDWEKAGLVKKYPIGLGIVSISPLSMVKAYSTIANGGKRLTPIAIRYIEDRNGNIIDQTEKKIRARNEFTQKQIISQDTAYIMQSMLQTTVASGTLAYARNIIGGRFTQATGGKTGTTQNWSDSWTLGFTPYYTSAVWFGFDRGGQSLGTNQTGAITTGPVWARYMEDINKNLPRKEFPRPKGIISVSINPDNNKRAVKDSEHVITEIFIAGTEPKEYDNPQERLVTEDFFKSQILQSDWNLVLPIDNTANSDAYFEFQSLNLDNLSLEGDNSESQNSDTSSDNEDLNIQINNQGLRLKLDSPNSQTTETTDKENPLLSN